MSKRQILILILFTFMLTLITDLAMQGLTDLHYPMVNLTDDWEVIYNDTTLGNTTSYSGVSDVHLGTASFNNIHRLLDFPIYDMDTITLSTTLPDYGDLELPTIYYWNRHCGFEIYLDGELYHSYEMKAYRNQTFIGCNNYLISLPRDYAGKKLSLKLYPGNMHSNRNTEQGTDHLRSSHDAYYYVFHDPSHISLGNYQDLEQAFIHKYYNELVCGSSLLFLGISFLGISIIFSFFVRKMIDHMLTALLFILLGFASHSYYGITFIFGDGTYDTFLVDLAIYLSLPVCLTLARTLHTPRHVKLHKAAELLTLIYSFVRISLHITNVLYMNEYYGFTFIPILFIIISIITGYQQERHSLTLTPNMRIQYVGIFLCLMLLLAAYLVTKMRYLHLLPNSPLFEHISTELMADGILFFEVANIINYLAIISESINQNTEYDILTRVAYEDVLTKLPNRAYMNKILNDMESSSRNYCIISLDVNDLKRVNDTYGHECGDRLLSNFGRILHEVFHKEGTSGRLGGDEFVVVTKTTSKEHLDNLLTLLELKLQEFSNQDADEWEYHAAYGYAFREEADNEHNTYLLADQRMYEHKNEMKRKKS